MNLQENIRRILKEETTPKKGGLYNVIVEYGLYGFLNDTQLSYNDVYNKIGDLPREVNIQYLKDLIIDEQQRPQHVDLTFISGAIPLYETDNGQTLYAASISNYDEVLRVYTFLINEEGYDDDHDVIDENNIDDETLDILVSEISEKLQHRRQGW